MIRYERGDGPLITMLIMVIIIVIAMILTGCAMSRKGITYRIRGLECGYVTCNKYGNCIATADTYVFPTLPCMSRLVGSIGKPSAVSAKPAASPNADPSANTKPTFTPGAPLSAYNSSSRA